MGSRLDDSIDESFKKMVSTGIKPDVVFLDGQEAGRRSFLGFDRFGSGEASADSASVILSSSSSSTMLCSSVASSLLGFA